MQRKMELHGITTFRLDSNICIEEDYANELPCYRLSPCIICTFCKRGVRIIHGERRYNKKELVKHLKLLKEQSNRY